MSTSVAESRAKTQGPKTEPVDQDVYQLADEAGRPPMDPPHSGKSVGSEFPDEGPREEYKINGQPVESYTLKMKIAEVETGSAVFIGVSDPEARDIIKARLKSGSGIIVSEKAPGEFVSHHDKKFSQGLYITSTQNIAADDLHTLVRRKLEPIMEIDTAPRLTSRRQLPPKPGPKGEHFDREVTKSSDPHVQKLLNTVLTVMKESFSVNTEEERGVVRAFMRQVEQNLSNLNLQGFVDSVNHESIKGRMTLEQKADYLQISNPGIEGWIANAFHQHVGSSINLPQDQAIASIPREATFFGNLHSALRKTLVHIVDAQTQSHDRPDREAAR